MSIESGRARVEMAGKKPPSRSRMRRSVPFFCFLLLSLAAGIAGAVLELRSSWLQSRIFTSLAPSATFAIEPGPAPRFMHPHSGPYDIQLGHSLLTEFLGSLRKQGFVIESQARASPELARMMEWGVAPPYEEKVWAGLHIFDRHGEAVFAASYPGRGYPDFTAIPPVIVDTLLFIENREALDTGNPQKNPAVEWTRSANALIDYAANRIGAIRDVSGGSTLATQLEKLRHSPGGRTSSVADKLRQMVSASMRAYARGPDTSGARYRIVAGYINSIPLAAIPGHGEVQGLGDGLWAWFDADFDTVNRLLAAQEAGESDRLTEQAVAYRQVLTLLVAVKKPTAFLVANRESLRARVDLYLQLLRRAGIISESLADRALAVRLDFRDRVPVGNQGSYAWRKGTDGVRIELLRTLGLRSVYDLDRLDLSVGSTLDGAGQRGVADFLAKLEEPDFAARAGLRQQRLLAEGDPAGVIYSVSVYERGPGVNYLRVQSDNLNQPLNINEGTKLELGSTAKLRTLASYLRAVAELHERFSPMSAEERAKVHLAAEDRISRWVVDYLNAAPDTDLPALLEAAIERRYPASSSQSFFTGGGLHRFSNFDPEDENRVVSVREALRRSVNLVFVRLMRDLVRYHIYRLPEVTPELFTNPRHPARADYLARFAQREGRQFLTRYYQKYEGLRTDEALQVAAAGIRQTPRRLAALYRLVRPGDGVDGMAAFLIGNLLDPDLPDELINRLYEEFAVGSYSLAERASITGLNPLELWLLQYKSEKPGASLGELFRESEPHCQVAYNWLFQSRNRRAQDRAIGIMVEADAFRAMHQEWKSQGYPFQRLVPSYATALGSSGDTPAALADFVGIIANGGFHYPAIRIERMHFALDTPFETNLRYQASLERRVMRPEVAALLRQELIGVVEHGTGRRAYGAILGGDGERVPIGGKTGTGDNRYEVFGPGGNLIESRVMNRTATFVFLIGDRFFGTVTAFVPGEQAARYRFTSSLPVQIFKELAPAFSALLEERPVPDLVAMARDRPLPTAPDGSDTLEASTEPDPSAEELAAPPLPALTGNAPRLLPTGE